MGKRRAAAPAVPLAQFVERPDGIYRIEGGIEKGPFATLQEARDDAAIETGFEPGETLAEAEEELGISQWIDPETGAPAEDTLPRLEDH